MERVLVVGLDEPEYTELRERLDMSIIAYEQLPRIFVRDGRLFVEPKRGPEWLEVSAVIYHAIYDNDFDFITGLALWGGACLPNAHAMMDCRLKFPCLVRALQHTRFGAPMRGYVAPHTRYYADNEQVAKWGNWHCGENKARFTNVWESEEPCIVEEFLPGQAVRVLLIGEQAWQIKLQGKDWLKSIHDPAAEFMEIDAELLDDTRTLRDAFGLEIIANDYIVGDDGTKHLLEVNHIPNVTRFPEVWQAYRDFAVSWVQSKTQTNQL